MTVMQVFPGVYRVRGKLATLSFAPGKRVYGEQLAREEGKEYRVWDLFRSKLAGAFAKGLKELPIHPGDRVLYLGASSGTTPSHVSDIVGENGLVFCVEFAPRSMRDLINVCNVRPNMLPILADARHPEQYADVDVVEVIYQDVAQPDQAEILIKNADAFLPSGGHALFCVKSQSIDVTVPPEKTFEMTLTKLEPHFHILQTLKLEPYDKDHLFIHCQKK